jgi:hypothetical protein
MSFSSKSISYLKTTEARKDSAGESRIVAWGLPLANAMPYPASFGLSAEAGATACSQVLIAWPVPAIVVKAA